MCCAIWYYLDNLQNVKNIHGGVLFLVKLQALAEAHLGSSQKSMTMIFAKIVNDKKLLTNFTKSFIIDVQLGPKYASAKP